jgi:[ribosomal protein S18]-alanine N-acetyltransferase
VDGVILRPATEADIEAIAAIQTAAYWSNFNELEPGSHDHPGYFEKVIAAANADAVADWRASTIAELAGVPVAVCMLEFGPALLSGLWVLPDMQGKGIGKLLIFEALERFKRRGEKLITIEVHPRNPAVRLYEQCGFQLAEVTTRRSNGLGRDLPLWVMTQLI